jgi:hypothetical protein
MEKSTNIPKLTSVPIEHRNGRVLRVGNLTMRYWRTANQLTHTCKSSLYNNVFWFWKRIHTDYIKTQSCQFHKCIRKLRTACLIIQRRGFFVWFMRRKISLSVFLDNALLKFTTCIIVIILEWVIQNGSSKKKTNRIRQAKWCRVRRARV